MEVNNAHIAGLKSAIDKAKEFLEQVEKYDGLRDNARNEEEYEKLMEAQKTQTYGVMQCLKEAVRLTSIIGCGNGLYGNQKFHVVVEFDARDSYRGTVKRERMRKHIILLLSVLCLTLTACKDEPVQGYVVGKGFTPAHTSVRYDVVLKKPMPDYHPDEWAVWVADSCGVRKVCVDSTVFKGLEKGNFVTLKDD